MTFLVPDTAANPVFSPKDEISARGRGSRGKGDGKEEQLSRKRAALRAKEAKIETAAAAEDEEKEDEEEEDDKAGRVRWSG